MRVPDSEREAHPLLATGYVLSGYLHTRIRGSDTPTRIMHVVIGSEKGGGRIAKKKRKLTDSGN